MKYFLRGYGIAAMITTPALYIVSGVSWPVAFCGIAGAVALFFGFRQ